MDKNTRFIKERVVRPMYGESSGDYVLPDYKGDVKKILMSCAELCPSGKFFNGGIIEHTGTVVYKVVYLDADNKMSGVEFTTDYSLETKSEEESYVDSYSVARVSNFTLRLMGPRKFSVKASLEGVMHISEQREISVEGNAFDFGEPECSSERIKVATMVTATLAEREYAELIADLEGVIEDDIEVLLSIAEPHSVSVSVQDGEALVTGELRMCLLASEENGVPRVFEKGIPLSEKVAGEGFKEGNDGFAIFNVTSVKPNVNATEDGVNITLDVIVELEVVAVDNTELSVMRDAFLIERDTVNAYEEITYTTDAATVVINERWEDELPLTEIESESLRNVCASYVQVVGADAQGAEKGIELKLKLKFNCIACEISEDGNAGYSPLRFERESTVFVNNACQIGENSSIECHIDAVSTFVETDGNKLYPSCILTGHVRVTDRCSATRLSSSVVDGEPIDKDASTVVVYYPSDEETLYDIAKKYHAKPLNIASQNALSESVFATADAPLVSTGVRKIIIR